MVSLATRTTNYRLTRPEQTDLVDIDVLNGNFDIIDTQMKANADRAAGKQDKLTFDTTPTQGSRNPVTSGGLYTRFQQKQDTAIQDGHGEVIFDDTPTEGSRNAAR